MPYPIEILPKKNYKKIFISRILQYDLILLRRIKFTTEKLTNNTNDIKSEFILEDSVDLYGMSVNLKGVSLEKHLGFIVKVNDDRDWNYCDKQPRQREFNKKYEKIDVNILYLALREIHNKDIDIMRNPSKKKNNVQSLKGKVKVEHTPKRSNFWHFELVVYDENKNLIKKTDSSWKKITAENFIKHELKRILKVNNGDQSTDLPSSEYIGQPCWKNKMRVTCKKLRYSSKSI